jgi:hydroxyacylglutathione hydrolase
MVEVLPIETPSLGDRSYLVHDGTVAIVIDPQRDTDRITALAERQGVRITHVAETHIHNDYVSGGLGLAQAAQAAYLVNSADPVGFRREPVSDGDTIDIGSTMRLRVLATAGHTFSHLSYVLESGGDVLGVFTGGSLLFGSTGRPDLLGPANTPALARAQFASAHRLADELPDSAEIYPTHGFGSFCAATQSHAASSTIGREKQVNPALASSEQAYVDNLLAGLDAFPAYYAHMGPANLAGLGLPDLSLPRPADGPDIRRRLESGEWVVDLRDRAEFSTGFVPGTFSFPLGSSFASYLGWVLPWGTPVTLLGDTQQQVSQAQRELVRIGIDRPAAAATGQPQQWTAGQPLASVRRATFGDLAARQAASSNDRLVLDVRRQKEWDDGHVANAIHIPFSDLPGRVDEVPPGDVWVYCHTGYRAMVAASMLTAAGRRVVCVDDEFGNADGAGLRIARTAARTVGAAPQPSALAVGA